MLKREAVHIITVLRVIIDLYKHFFENVISQVTYTLYHSLENEIMSNIIKPLYVNLNVFTIS